MKVNLKIILILFAIYSCNDRNEKYTNDMENIDGWFHHEQIKNGFANSGNYYCITTEEKPYSITFRKKINKFKEGEKINKISVSAWVMFTNKECQASLVASIDSSDNFIPVVYTNTNLTSQSAELKKWVELKLDLNIPNNIDRNFFVSIYVKNTGKFPVLVDDISYSLK